MRRRRTAGTIFSSMSRFLVATCACLSLQSVAQSQSEHESHHPRPASDTADTQTASPMNEPAISPDSAASATPGTPAPPSGGMGMGMGMKGSEGMEMERGAGRAKELYPALMQLEELTPATRVNFERLARQRMHAGTTLVSQGLHKLELASSPEDLLRMQEATVQIRQGVDQFQTGLAALQALSEGQAPRRIALDWFRSSMNLPVADVVKPHGVFGLSTFHYFSMFLLIATIATLLWMNFRKMQRSEALVSRLVSSSTSSIPLPTEQITAPAQPPPKTLPTDQSPSKSNSWTGLLRVVRIFQETSNVRTLRLADPSGGETPFRHLPGQFVTFTVKPIDQAIKRSYTIASSPTRRDYLEVTVKREEHGTVSSFLHGVHEGDTLQVTGPSGNFTFVGEGANSIVLIAGGVGVTPMMSVLRYLTDRSWSGQIFFIYACKSEGDVIYKEELEYLQRRYPNLSLTITVDEASAQWAYQRGYITAELLSSAVPHIETRRIHLCGPPRMMAALKTTLAQIGVNAEQIKTEVFIGKEVPVRAPSSAEEPAPVSKVEAGPQPVSGGEPSATPESAVAVVTFARSRQTALLPPNKTVLEASEDVGVNIDYSCRVGVCGVCKVKLLSGAVSMEVQEALDENDKRNGVILACQAKSTGDVSVDA